MVVPTDGRYLGEVIQGLAYGETQKDEEFSHWMCDLDSADVNIIDSNIIYKYMCTCINIHTYTYTYADTDRYTYVYIYICTI